MDKDKRIKKEVARLRKFYKDADKTVLDFALPLIDNAAFMTITLKDLMDDINLNGVTSEYQNGENQYGKKKSPAVETYNTMQKNHASLMKQLADMIPKKDFDTENNADGFEDFVGDR